MLCDPPAQLVLLDVTLPDLSGHEVCTKMRSLAPGVPPPIIMISGKASTKDVIKGLQAGSCDYITKPFQPQVREGEGGRRGGERGEERRER